MCVWIWITSTLTNYLNKTCSSRRRKINYVQKQHYFRDLNFSTVLTSSLPRSLSSPPFVKTQKNLSRRPRIFYKSPMWLAYSSTHTTFSSFIIMWLVTTFVCEMCWIFSGPVSDTRLRYLLRECFVGIYTSKIIHRRRTSTLWLRQIYYLCK